MVVLKQQLKTVVYKPHVEASQSEALYLNRQASSFNFYWNVEVWQAWQVQAEIWSCTDSYIVPDMNSE